jgi:Ca-activated chloride channel family protein
LSSENLDQNHHHHRHKDKEKLLVLTVEVPMAKHLQPIHHIRRVRYPLQWVWLIVIGLVCVWIPIPAHAQGGSTADPTFVRITQVDAHDYPNITIYVSATQHNGQPIAGLTQREFSIKEDGVPVDIIDFKGGDHISIATALVIDRSDSMRYEDKLQGARNAARAFVKLMQPGDETALIAFSETPELLEPFTSDQDRLSQGIKNIKLGSCTAIYDSIIEGVDVLREKQGRRVLLLLTDGQDCRHATDDDIRELGSSHTVDEAIAYAQEHDQPVYVVGLGSRSSFSVGGIDERVLEEIADETYGDYFYAPTADQLESLYRHLSGDIHDEYAITYKSPRPFYDGTRRDIQVEVGESVSVEGYTEQHLINVDSRFIVGVILLMPLLVLLFLPWLLFTKRPPPTSSPSSSSSSVQGTNIEVEDEEEHPRTASPPTPQRETRCVACGAPLRPNARFCGACGSKQPPSSGSSGSSSSSSSGSGGGAA